MGMAIGNPPPRAPYKMANGLMYCEECHCTYNPTTVFVRGFRLRPRDTMPGSNFYATSEVPKGECPSCGKKEEQPSRESETA
jgi:hypothetical protein